MVHTKDQTDALANELDQQCKLDQHSSTPKKKSNKKKSKKNTVESLNPLYENFFLNIPIAIKNTKAKGRHAVATENLAPGMLASNEKAVAFVVRSDFIDEQCHVCLSTLEQKLMCGDCKKVFYCSNSCMEKDERHRFLCDALDQIDGIAQATDVDADLIRLIITLMAQKHLDKDKKSGLSNNQATSSQAFFWCVDDLVSHRDKAEPIFLAVVKEACQRVLSELPESIHIPVDDMVTLACIINSNAHGLGDSNSRNTDVALGIFPLAAMFFNHGCNPNAVFVGLPHGHLAIRTIRPVAKDEEIVLNYIDLYLSRDERRKELIESKHFWCKCKRCVAPIEKSVDRFLNGVICKQCTNDVYVIPPTPLDDILRGQSSLYLDDKAIYKCAICQHEIPCQFIREKLEEATIAYRNGVSAMRSKDYKRAQRIFENLLSKTDRGGEIHPLNSIRLNTYTSLMNCKMYYHDVKGAIDANKCILNMMREYASVGSLPDKTSEISDYLNNLGELCCDMANETKSRSMILEKKWKKEAITAYKEALDVRIIVYGKNHIKTKHIEDSIKALH